MYQVALEKYDAIDAKFEILAQDRPFRLKHEWTAEDSTQHPSDIIAEMEFCDGGAITREILGNRGDTYYKVGGQVKPGSKIEVLVIAAEYDAADATMKHLKKMWPVLKSKTEEVNFTFVNLTPIGEVRRRDIPLVVPTYETIRSNYPKQTKAAIESMLTRNIEDDGRIALWSGPPGTGKTYFIRTLAREWQNWAKVYYIIDPENFFGHSTDYITSLILDNDGDSRWSVFILEDTGEMFSPSAKQSIGQGLSRLLNFSDGILGQGTKSLILLTTNEEVRQLHPALTRPGRCFANVHFGEFPPEEANAWLEGNGSSYRTSNPMTLAQMYEKIGKSPITNPQATHVGMEVG